MGRSSVTEIKEFAYGVGLPEMTSHQIVPRPYIAFAAISSEQFEIRLFVNV